jgi:hypothetical protein
MSKPPIHTIVETAAFTAQASRIGMSQTELAALYDQYASEPSYGKVIRHTGGLRKGRVSKDATGKSGGYRVFSFYADDANPVFLLWIIDKSADATLTDAQEKAFKQMTTVLKEALR